MRVGGGPLQTLSQSHLRGLIFDVRDDKLEILLNVWNFIDLDLIGTWEELFVELKSRLDQCLAFNGINKEIEIISLKVESISNQKLELETQEENDAISYKACLQVII